MDTSFIKTDNNKVIYTECIYWVDKLGECLEICTNPDKNDIHKICKSNNPENYKLLNNLLNSNNVIKKK